MSRIRLAAGVLGSLFTLNGCAGNGATSIDPQTELASTAVLSVMEVTTVTTVQGSSGAFLSPRSSLAAPAYLQRGSATPSISFPPGPSATDRAKVDIALLFRAAEPGSMHWHLDASLAARSGGGDLPSVEHFFPKLNADQASVSWPLELGARVNAEFEPAASSEWTGWRAFPGLGVAGSAQPALTASAATLDYDTLGMSAPLVLASSGEDMIVTNRSDAVIWNALLIYSHPGGIGIRVVPELVPGQQLVTTTGPKEGPRSQQLDEARQQMTEFFALSLGDELGGAVAQAKSVPFLETQGMRLVYMLPDAQIPAQITFSEGLNEDRRVVISQAEVFLQAAEADVLSGLADNATLDAASAVSLLGRFTQAKLEYAAQSGDEQVSVQSSNLLSALAAEESQ